jgi:hypothetical protein
MVVIVASALIAGPARAEPSRSATPPPPSPKDQQRALAAELRARGNAEANAGRLDEARKLWLDAWNAYPGQRSVACNIGKAWLQKGQYIDAATWLTRCVKLPAGADTPEMLRRRRTEVVDLELARAHVVTLQIETEPGAALSVDGEEVGTSPAEQPIYVNRGHHRIEARKGQRSAVAAVDAKEGETHRMLLPLKPAEPPLFEEPQASPSAPPPPPLASTPAPPSKQPPPPLHTEPQMTWWPIFLGTTLGSTALISGVMLRLAADNRASEVDDLNHTVATEIPGVACGTAAGDHHPKCDTLVRADQRRVEYTNASTAAFIVSGVALAGAIGFAAYETHRVRITPTIGGFAASYQW